MNILLQRCLPNFLLSLLIVTGALGADERPNILWITSEDNSPFLGCYGDENVHTPNLDALAERGVRYENFFANAPVCAPARSSWILGTPASTAGTLHMRSKYRVPQEIFKTYPELLKDSGYYVTNDSKTDYNTRSINEDKIWDECSSKAHYKNRPDGTPFFAVYNTKKSHESSIFPERKPDHLRVPKEAIDLPPYQVATPETIDDWRAYYERMEVMDRDVGRKLDELEALGEADNTIVVYCSDHGGVTLRSKRYLYDSGTRVPMIVYFPEKWKHLAPASDGAISDRLAQFIDLPRSFLSLTGVEAPSTMTGNLIFGKRVDPAPETVFLFGGRFDEAPDNSRAVTDGRWKYIRNFEPDRPRFQMLSFPLRQEGQQSQLEAYRAGLTNPLQSAFYEAQPPEELYDTSKDPHEINNLVDSEPAKLEAMRAELRAQVLRTHDLGFMPEPLMQQIDLSGDLTVFEYGQIEENYPLEAVYDMAVLASAMEPRNSAQLAEALKHENASLRYWAALGLRVLGEQAIPAAPALEAALSDSSPSVRITAAVALGRTGNRDRAIELLLSEAGQAEFDMHAVWALDGLKLLNVENPFKGMTVEEMKSYNKGRYSSRLVERFEGIAGR